MEGEHDDEVERTTRWAFVGAAGEVDKRERERCLRRNAGRHGETRAVRFASQWWNADKGKENNMNAVFKMMLAEDRRVERDEREVWHEKRERRERDERVREGRRLGAAVIAAAFAAAGM